MHELSGKRFVASYSGGKDSVLALHRAKKLGLVPIKLITTYNTDLNRSWFHGIPEPLLKRTADSLALPIELIKTSGAEYEKNFENALSAAKYDGAEVCIFGDIDIDEHLEWCSARCRNVGITPFFPLWQEERKKLVYEFVEAGYSAIITTIDTSRMSAELLGHKLDAKTLAEIEKSGVDVCGENGEYHTFVYDGPMFTQKVRFSCGEAITLDKYAIMPLLV